MSEIKSLAAPKASFDRRSVVKGAAWSVPVIAAAIAAPAAAASVNVTVAFAVATRRVNLNPRNVVAPESFTVENSRATIVGPQLFSISVTPTPGTGFLANKMARIGVSTVAGVAVVGGKFDNKNAFTGTVSVPGSVATSRVFDLAYTYARSNNETHFGSYAVVVSLTSVTPAVSGSSTLTDS